MAADTENQAPLEPDPRKAFGHTYWMLNSIEMFERLAYFGIRAVVPIYIMQATEPGGLHLTALHKGWIYMWWALLQSWLPMFTGGIADRYGYKRVLTFSISANIIGYLMMASFHDYYGFFAGILVLATGTAFFKPALQGSIAQNLTKENSSMGWGVFYWVVNIGAVLAPILATLILGKPHSAEGWRNLFFACAGFTACNLFLLFTFKDVPSGADKSQGMLKVFGLTVENIWPYWFRGGSFHRVRGPLGIMMALAGLAVVILVSGQWGWGVALLLVGTCLATWLQGGQFIFQLRLPAFLLIMSCFWMMMYQLWDLHPNFIEDWIDSSMVAAHVPTDTWREYGDRGLVRVPQQILLNLNAFLIVLFIVPISYLVRKMRTLSAMLMGMTVATIGVLVAGLTGSGWIFLLGVVFFSLGEMLTGPKKNQYLGLIAPPGKKGLYLGYVNIPVGIGVGIGSVIAGSLYDNYGEKAGLALKELATRPKLVARAAQGADWSDVLEKVPVLLTLDRDQAFEEACTELELEPEAAAEYLRESFRYDRGQIENLALQYLALHHTYREKTAAGLGKLSEQALALVGAPQENQAAEDAVAPSDLRPELASAETDGAELELGRFVHLLPEVLDVKRVVAFELLRELVNKDTEPGAALQDAQLVDLLWARFGAGEDVLENLALEYLAQGTPRVKSAVAGMTYRHPPKELAERVEEIEDRIGIDRMKSFAALSVALGAEEAKVEAALAKLSTVGGSEADRVYVYLAQQPHVRFMAVGRKDWKSDVDLLERMLESDPAARQYAAEHVDERGWYDTFTAAVGSLFVDDDDADKRLAHRLADNQEVVQEVMTKKDWAAAPEQAAQLLGLNVFEAQALAAAEVNHASLAATRLLWDKYYPQYRVWLPFAGIGVLAIIALGIFGQMAKRWTDMNA